MSDQKTYALMTALVSLLLIVLGGILLAFVFSREERREDWWTSWRAALLQVVGGAGVACILGGAVGLGMGLLVAIG